jgi:hypothetical protein
VLAFASVTIGQLYVYCNTVCCKYVKVLYCRKREEVYRQVDFEKKKQWKGTKLAENINKIRKILDLKEKM